MRLSIGLAVIAMGLGLMSCQASGDASTTQSTANTTYTHEASKTLYIQARYQEDEAMCLAAIAEIERTDGPKSPKLAGPLDDLSAVYLRTDRFSEAKAPLERAESVLDKSTRSGAIQYARLCINKGWLQYSLGDVSASEEIFKEGRDLLRKYEKEPTVDLAELINNIGIAYGDNEDEDETKSRQGKLLLLKSWEMRRQLTGDDSPECAESLNNIGLHLLFHGETDDDLEAALKTLEKAAAVSEKAYGKQNPETAMAYTNLAAAYQMTQQNDLASAEIHKAIPITEKYFGKGSTDNAYELQVLGQILQSQQKYKDAETAYQQALAITQKVYGPTNPLVASALDYLASLYEAMGDDKKQAEMQKQIEKLRGRDI